MTLVWHFKIDHWPCAVKSPTEGNRPHGCPRPPGRAVASRQARAPARTRTATTGCGAVHRPPASAPLAPARIPPRKRPGHPSRGMQRRRNSDMGFAWSPKRCRSRQWRCTASSPQSSGAAAKTPTRPPGPRESDPADRRRRRLGRGGRGCRS
jgi:hypothetical protein